MTLGLSARQKTIVLIAWLCYASYYLGRVNISTALTSLELGLDLTKTQTGAFLTGFFLVYALSTLINGYLGDKLSPRWFVFIGLMATACLNLLFGLSSNWLILMMIWCLNGYFQATGWGPILRTLDSWLSSSQKSQVSSLFGSSFVAGSALTWLITGWCVSQLGWRWAFYVPSIYLFCIAFIWFIGIRDKPLSSEAHPPFFQGLPERLRRYGLLALAAFFIGLIFGVISLWSPTYFVEAGKLDVGIGSSIAALLPIAGILGISFTSWMIQKYFVFRELNLLRSLLIFLGALCLIYSFLPFSLVLALIMTMSIAACAYAATTLILSTLPVMLSKQGETSGTAGLMDFSFALGTALSGVLIAEVLASFSWSVVFQVLASSAFLALMFILSIRSQDYLKTN